jgi:hypothetical protein
MSPILKYFIFQAVIIGPFAAGYLLKRRFASPAESSRKIVRANLIFIEPLIALWAIWGLRMRADLMLLPLSGLALVLLGLGLGVIIARCLGLAGKTRATFIISSSLANHSFTMGGFICYLLMGETGLGFSFIFISYFMVYIYLVIFPYARRSSLVEGDAPSPLSHMLDLQNMPLAAVIAAVALNLAGAARPAVPFPSDLLLAVSVASYYFSLGLNFSLSDVPGTLRESAALSLVKFALVPAAAIIILLFAGLPRDISTVIAVQSFMPAAIFSVLASILFGLDTRLASGFFVSSTLIFVAAVLPIILLILPALF